MPQQYSHGCDATSKAAAAHASTRNILKGLEPGQRSEMFEAAYTRLNMKYSPELMAAIAQEIIDEGHRTSIEQMVEDEVALARSFETDATGAKAK